MTEGPSSIRDLALTCPDRECGIRLGGILKEYIDVRRRRHIKNSSELAETARALVRFYLFQRANPNLRMTISGVDPAGNRYEGSVADGFGCVFSMIARDIANSACEAQHVLDVARTVSQVLASGQFPQDVRLGVLAVEAEVLAPHYRLWLRDVPLADVNALFSRREYFVASTAANGTSGNEGISELYDALVRAHLRVYVDRLLYKEAVDALFRLLDGVRNCPELIGKLAHRLVTYNNLFAICTKDEIRSRLDDFLQLTTLAHREAILKANATRFDQVELRDVNITQKDHGLSCSDLETLTTYVRFVVPRRLTSGPVTLRTKEGIVVCFTHMKSLLDDPVAGFFGQLDSRVNEMPMEIFCDSYPDFTACSSVSMHIPSFFHPDFEVVAGDVKEHPFEEESARIGRRFYPVKQKVVEIFREVYRTAVPFPLEADLPDVDLNLFSAFLVDYRDSLGASVFHRAHTLTTWERYPTVLRFVGDARRQQDVNDFVDIRALVQDTAQPATDQDLRVFTTRALELAFKRTVEKKGIWKYLWGGDVPIDEPQSQPLVETHLAGVLALKGAKLSREVVCANGRLDFLCTATAGSGRGLTVCIEMKNAHNPRLLHGLQQQLPSYMEDQGTRDGVFLVLWYKQQGFDEPDAFKSSRELHENLVANVPKGHRIDVVIVNCTRPTAPSRLPTPRHAYG